jgi:hypothetical protein
MLMFDILNEISDKKLHNFWRSKNTELPPSWKYWRQETKGYKCGQLHSGKIRTLNSLNCFDCDTMVVSRQQTDVMREQNTPQGCIFSFSYLFSVLQFLLAVATWFEKKLSFSLSNVDPLNRSATHNFPHGRHRSLVLLSTMRPVRLAKLYSAAVSRLQNRRLCNTSNEYLSSLNEVKQVCSSVVYLTTLSVIPIK